MNELQELSSSLKALFKQQRELCKMIGELPKEQLDLISKASLIEFQISELTRRFEILNSQADS